MWAETYASAHISGKLPTYLEKALPYVGSFPEMWAETYVSAHIPGKLPTYQEKAPPLKRKLPFWGRKKSERAGFLSQTWILLAERNACLSLVNFFNSLLLLAREVVLDHEKY